MARRTTDRTCKKAPKRPGHSRPGSLGRKRQRGGKPRRTTGGRERQPGLGRRRGSRLNPLGWRKLGHWRICFGRMGWRGDRAAHALGPNGGFWPMRGKPREGLFGARQCHGAAAIGYARQNLAIVKHARRHGAKVEAIMPFGIGAGDAKELICPHALDDSGYFTALSTVKTPLGGRHAQR